MKVGIDIIEVARVSETEKFLNKIAFASEIEYINSFKCKEGRLQRIAALWCVKEAVMKCLGLGKDSSVSFHDIQLCHEESGRPYVKLFGVAKSAFETQNLTEIEISLSHSETQAIAICVAK